MEAQKPKEEEKAVGGDSAVKIGDVAVDFAKVTPSCSLCSVLLSSGHAMLLAQADGCCICC